MATTSNVTEPVLVQNEDGSTNLSTAMDVIVIPETSTPESSVKPLFDISLRGDLGQNPFADLFSKLPPGPGGGERSDAGLMLLEEFGNARRERKRWRESSLEDKPFDFDQLSPLERAMLCLLEKCMTGFSDLRTIVNNLKPADQTEVQALRREVEVLQKTNVTLRQEVQDLKEEQEEHHLESTTRSMREDLLFHGIPEVSLPKGQWENTNKTLRDFMVNELKMGQDEALDYHISISHRLGRRKSFKETVTTTGEHGQARGPRPIVARFVVRDDRDFLKGMGNKTLKHRGRGKVFSLSDHFPRTVVTRRKKLIPVLIEKKAEGKTVKLVADKLYINNELFLHEDFPWLKKPSAVVV